MQKKYQIFIMATVLCLYAAASFFIYPQADDYWYAMKYFNNGFVQTQINEYLGWNGRYTATAILSFSPLVWGSLFIYRLAPIALILFTFLSSVFMVKKVFSDKLTKNEHWFFGLSLTFLWYMSFFTISQGLYWMAGSYTYNLSGIFFNMAVGYFWGESKKMTDYLLLSFFAALMIGCNETVMILWLYTIGVTEFLWWIETKKIRKRTICIFLVSFIFALIVVKAPGNAVRAAHHLKSHQLLRTLGNSFVYTFIYPVKFACVPLVIYFVLNFDRLKKLFNTDFLLNKRKYLFIAWIGVTFISFAPSLWGMGRKPNERTIDIIVLFYILGFFPVMSIYVKKIPLNIQKNWLVCSLVLSMNNFDLVKDYSGPFYYYQERWSKLIESYGKIVIHDDKRPITIRFNDVEAHQSNFEDFLKIRPQFFK